jgi:hypothetical protein
MTEISILAFTALKNAGRLHGEAVVLLTVAVEQQ